MKQAGILLAAVLGAGAACAQDLEKLGKENPFKVSGGVSGGMMYYEAAGIQARRDPFYWNVNGNLNLSFYELSVPISVTLSRQDSRLVYQPFNQIGFSPKYRSVTAHLGYRSMEFSELVMAGTIFLGAGVEVKPKDSPFYGAVMYGRLAREITEVGSGPFGAGQPAFERRGYGAKAGFRQKGTTAELMFFRGRDFQGGISDSVAGSLGIMPEENFVTGTKLKQVIAKKWSVYGEYALSAYSHDIRLPEEERTAGYRYVNYLGPVYTPRSSTSFNNALIGGAAYNAATWQLGVKYRRIDPEYRSMGVPFMINDMEDITGTLSKRLFGDKVNVALSAGFQRNNLDELKASTTARRVGSANVSWMITPKLNMQANYANFNTNSTQSRFFKNSLTDNRVDSIFYLQITQSAGAGLNYNVAGTNVTHGIFTSFNYQGANDNASPASKFYNANAGWQFTFTGSKLSINPGFNYNKNLTAGFNITSWGPGLSASKPVVKEKLLLTAGANLLNSQQAGAGGTLIHNYRLAATYTYAQKHNLTADTGYLISESSTEGAQSYSELRAGINYAYSF